VANGSIIEKAHFFLHPQDMPLHLGAGPRAFAIFTLASFLIFRMSTESAWESPYEGWRLRAKTHPSPEAIDFDKLKLLLRSTYSAMGGEGFNMALFERDSGEYLLVNAIGQVRILQPDDAAGFQQAMRGSLELSNTEYRIKHSISCRPFSIVHLAKEDGEFRMFSIYGYSKSTRSLEQFGKLPRVLWELCGLVEESNSPDPDEVSDSNTLSRMQRSISGRLE
jgi:hypothetical protein